MFYISIFSINIFLCYHLVLKILFLGFCNISRFPTQGSNPGLVHCRQILYHLSHQGHPVYHDYAMVTQPISSPFPFTEFSFSFLFFRNTLAVLDVLEGRTHTISLPINLQTVFLVAEDKWLLVESKTNQWVDLQSTSWSVLSFPASLYIGLSSCVCLLTFLYLAGETLKKRGGENLNVT